MEVVREGARIVSGGEGEAVWNLARGGGQIYSQRSPDDIVLVQGDADQTFLGLGAENVPNEAEDVRWGFDGERFHVPSPLNAARTLCPVVGCVGRWSDLNPMG